MQASLRCGSASKEEKEVAGTGRLKKGVGVR